MLVSSGFDKESGGRCVRFSGVATHSARIEVARLEREIAATDEEIDNLVYGLYRITDEERKLIEAT
jgi:hypothetical protein